MGEEGKPEESLTQRRRGRREITAAYSIGRREEAGLKDQRYMEEGREKAPAPYSHSGCKVRTSEGGRYNRKYDGPPLSAGLSDLKIENC